MIEVDDLHVDYKSKRRPPVSAVRGVSFTIEDNELVGLVGESGCGKSTLGYAMIGLLDSVHHGVTGRVLFNGVDLLSLSDEQLRQMRWQKFSTVLQGGMNSFNPVIKIKYQFMDGMRQHTKMSQHEMAERIKYLLGLVKIDPSVAELYPHELSGGMKQRVAIAMALSLDPELIIMDEPTTALDVVVQHAIVRTLVELQKKLKFAVLFISHDLGLVLEIASRIVVMYAGQMVEVNEATKILAEPMHPYTQALMNCYADPRSETVSIEGIPGSPPDLSLPIEGCAFAPRCSKAWTLCQTTKPPLVKTGTGSVLCHLYGEGEHHD